MGALVEHLGEGDGETKVRSVAGHAGHAHSQDPRARADARLGYFSTHSANLDGVLNINQGSLYPALYRLEQQGWITSEWGSSENNRQAKFYELTRTGRKQLTEETENWERLSTAIAHILETA